MAKLHAHVPLDEEHPSEPSRAKHTVLEEPRVSFVSFVNRLLGGDRVASLAARIAKQAVDESVSAPMPEKIDRFDVIRELGRGGFGIVYLAKDSTLDREVAIKAPHSWLAEDAAAGARCLKEAQLASKLRHPGIVTIHDIREREGRIEYVVQEYVQGSTLHDLMSRRSISTRAAIELVLKIAEAIAAAHTQGVYHRDLKPANLIVDSQGGAHILDFGLAIDDETQLQLRGQIAGTAAYMSPEQLRGDAHHLDGRTDIWSLGVIFYELLTGRRPFRGNSQDAIEQVLKRAPTPPRQFQASIPKRVEVACLKCLEKSVEDRYASANDLIEELRAILTSEALPTSETKTGFSPEVESDVDTKRLVLNDTKRQPVARVPHRGGKRWIGLFLLLTSVAALVSLPVFYFVNGGFGVAAPGEVVHVAKGDDIDLLASEPIRMVCSGNGSVVDEYHDGKLIFKTNAALVRAFKEPILDENYDIAVRFKQTGSWKGNVGVLYGVKPSLTAPGEFVGYLVEVYDHPLKTSPWKMCVSQVVFRRGEPVIKANTVVKSSFLLKGEPQSVPSDTETLELRIRNGQLRSASFNGFFYAEPGLMTIEDFTGALKFAERHKVSVAEMTGQAGVKVNRANVEVIGAVAIPR